MGDLEARASALVESSLGYHSCIAGFLTCGPESGRGTLLDGQFDWGGRLQKSNGGVQRFLQKGWKSFVERKGIKKLDCDTYKWSRYESRT